MGPVTPLEYVSRKDRYDTQLVEKLGLTKDAVKAMPVEEKIRRLYEHRQDQYQRLADAVYHRRGWTQNGVPTPQKMRSLGCTDERMFTMLQAKIDEDEAKGLNDWGGKYAAYEKPPAPDRRYWEKW
jgi:aldehyde:ferredoxin oxidoreductase